MACFKAYFCRGCGWRSPAHPMGWAISPKCPDCRHRLSFVVFEEHEKAEAEAIAGGELSLMPGLTASDSSAT